MIEDVPNAIPEARPDDPAVAATRQAQLRAWGGYNWASHGWACPVAAVLIGPWMLALATHTVGDHGTLIRVGPVRLIADAYPSAMITVAALLQLVVLPFIGSLADRDRNLRRWLAAACAAGSAISASLALTSGKAWVAAGLLYVFGSLMAGASDLAWNGMLPGLARAGRRDAVSSRATAVGYLGAGAILGLDLILVQGRSVLGLAEATAVRICFVTAALWWVGFGLPSIRRLPGGVQAPGASPPGSPPAGVAAPGSPAGDGTGRASPAARDGGVRPGRSLLQNLALLRTMPQVSRFVGAYILFADATSAVLSLASTYVTHQLFHNHTVKATPFLFELILMVQFVAVGGALGFGRLSRRFGTKRALVAALLLWTAAVVFAYAVLHSKVDALIAGFAMGISLGGTTALARSLFSRMIPAGREATWFSLYEVCSEGTAWLAPLLFTIVVDITGSFRQAMLSLVVLFVVGLVLLGRTDTDEAAREAATVAAV